MDLFDQCIEDFWSSVTNISRTLDFDKNILRTLDLCDQCIENGSMKADHCGLSVSFSKVDDLPIPHVPTMVPGHNGIQSLQIVEEMMSA